MKVFALLTAGLMTAGGVAYFAQDSATTTCQRNCSRGAVSAESNADSAPCCSGDLSALSCCSTPCSDCATDCSACCTLCELCCSSGAAAPVTASVQAVSDCCAAADLCCTSGAACCIDTAANASGSLSGAAAK
jgi:hypothetical protein